MCDPLNEGALDFAGFDANEPDGHYSFARFIIEKMGLYDEYSDIELNSHDMASLPRYRSMLAAYNQQADKRHIGLTQLQQIANAAETY